MLRHSIVALCCGVTLGAFAMLAVEAKVFTQVPTIVTDPDEEGRYVVNGKILEMHFKFIRTRECNSISTTWIWRWINQGTGDPQRYFVPVNSAPVTLAEVSAVVQDFTLALSLPPAVTPGQWFVRTKFLDYCRLAAALLGPTVRKSRDVPVTVP